MNELNQARSASAATSVESPSASTEAGATVALAWLAPARTKWRRRALALAVAATGIASLACRLLNAPVLVSAIIAACCGTAAALFGLGRYAEEVRGSFVHRERRDAQGKALAMPMHATWRTFSEVVVVRWKGMREIEVERMREHGAIYLLQAGFTPIVVVTSLPLAREISEKHNLFVKSDPRELGMPFYFEWVGNDNIVLARGSAWRRLRARITPPVNALDEFFPVFARNSCTLITKLREQVGANQTCRSRVVPLSRWLKAVSLDSAGETLFSFDFRHLLETTNPGIKAADFVLAEVFNPTRRMLPFLNRLPTRKNRALRISMQRLDRLVYEMIEAMQARRSGEGERARSVLELLIHDHAEGSLSDSELRNNILAMLVASHETTQASLGAIIYLMAKFQEQQNRIRVEIMNEFPNASEFHSKLNSPDINTRKDFCRRLQSLRYLDGFILECLRIHSPLSIQNLRTTAADCELGGYKIPRGSLVTINIHALHMNPEVWENPDQLWPERHQKLDSTTRHAHMAFGAGPRSCAGRAFTLLEQKIIICQLLNNFRIDLPHPGYKYPLQRSSFTGQHKASFKLRFTDISTCELPPRTDDVHCSAVSAPPESTLKKVHLRYPARWFSPQRVSSFSNTVSEQTIAWLDRLCLLPDRETYDHVVAMEPQYYAGYSMPAASYEQTLLYCKYITLWLLWDDQVVEKAEDLGDISRALAALAGEECEDCDPFCIGFREIGDGYSLGGATTAWRRRFAHVMLEWATYAVQEGARRRAPLSCTSRYGFEQALRVRSFTVGIRPNSIPLERALGFELTPAIYLDSVYADLMNCAATICSLVNDLVSLHKDRANSQQNSNMVLYHQASHNCSLQMSCDAIVAIHEKMVIQFDRLAAKLITRCAREFSERLTAFISNLRYMDSGFAYWHRDCARYHKCAGQAAWCRTELVIEQRDAEPTAERG